MKIFSKKVIKRSLWAFLVLFVILNIIAVFHSYKFTHFASASIEKTKDPAKLSAGQKIITLIFGVSNPRPENTITPACPYETVVLNDIRKTECWSLKTDSAKGTVIIFHGFSGSKSSMLDKAYVFRELGYNCLLVDFMGSGGSEGDQTTIGYLEAEQVLTCYNYIMEQKEQHIFLFGTSMGSAALMKAINDHGISPDGIIIECPFGSMYKTVCARFRSMNVPSFPMAGLLVFWGGIINGFWAFGHDPAEYAVNIKCPVLLMYGAKDDKVSREETDEIFGNLNGPKELKIFEEAAHENYLVKYKPEWTRYVNEFLNNYNK